MDKKEFEFSVSKLATPDDLIKNQSLIGRIDESNYITYLSALKLGYKMYPIFNSIHALEHAAKQLEKDASYILESIPLFEQLIEMLGACSFQPISNDTWYYETKCRRCGFTSDWHFSEKKQITASQFHLAISSYLQEPRSYRCAACSKETVQDVVSYN